MCSSFTLSIRYLIDEARVWQKIGENNREAHLNDIQSVSQNATPPVESQLETKPSSRTYYANPSTIVTTLHSV